MVSVFVALITFVSSQVNIFKDQTIGAALGFDLILSGILIAFVLLIHFVSKSLILEDIGSKVKNENTNSLPNYLFIVAILLVAFGVLVLQHEGTSKKIGQDATMIVQPVNIIQRM